MTESVLSDVDDALLAYAKGSMVIVVDDEDRENEGDLVLAADFVTPEAINFMVTHGRGLVCLAMRGALLDRLQIPMMVPQAQNRSGFGTGFTLSVEAVKGVSTGISAEDRAVTIKTLIDPDTKPNDIAMPGHIFPLRARDGGVLERRGQTEAGVDISALAGLTPAGVICEIMREDGSMMRLEELANFGRIHNVPIISVEQLAQYRMHKGQRGRATAVLNRDGSWVSESSPGSPGTSATTAGAVTTESPATTDNTNVNDASLSARKPDTPAVLAAAGATNATNSTRPSSVIEIGRSQLPTENGLLDMIVFRDTQGLEHAALLKGDLTQGAPLVRLHSECLTGDAFGSLRCDCGPQLQRAMKLVSEQDSGAIIYLRQEGRGIGLGNKIRAYALQDGGLDTVDANQKLGFPADARNYDVAVDILRQLGASSVTLLSNNPAKHDALVEAGITVDSRQPLVTPPQSFNAKYLDTKAQRMRHNFGPDS